MRNISVLLTMLLFFIALPARTQEQQAEQPLQFSLNEARTYALNNSPVLLNSARDVEIARKKIWENTATGLPQASLNSSYAYTPELAGLSDQLGEFIPDFNPEDLKTSFLMTIQVNQLLFNGQYIVGLQAAKVYAGFSRLADTRSKIGILESITNTYFTTLIARETKSVLDSTLAAVEKTNFETEQMYKNGFVEATDVDQLKILVSNIKSSLSVAIRQSELLERLLKYQMGLPIEKSIVLTDNIDLLVAAMNLEASITDSFRLEKNIDFNILDTQEKLMKLNLQATMSQYLPTVSGYYAYYKSLDENFFNDQSPNTFGLSLSLPLFSSGQRMSQVSQKRIDFLKAQTNKQMAAESLLLQYETAHSEYLSAQDIYVMQKENRDLSQRIYRKSIIKFREGIGSSLDLNLTQSQFFEAEGMYFNALISLVSAKTKLESLLAESE
ncbi:MAG TPA: TolC family protein [Bacteroidales bacterium]|nr:TolC family protein [Bacteroidales bacterium]